ncbi:PD-(D/E)XK nuclease family protein [Spiroplasma endosymbiont of Nebria brevicollis]|uniref:PD-(D/E)XK nuclease family protein n=1 Tax=Spiroplasma endosymbiont of Nebria brevicollis TaxID=3066284 RepID=UPI00313E7C8E
MNKLVFKKDTHQYFIKNKELISVSKIINNYLGSNYDNVPKDVLKNAAVRGQWVHKLNELYLQNINKENIINDLLNKLKPLTNEINYSYCEKSLIFLKEKFIDKDNFEFIIEEPISHNYVAGIPDLIYLDKKQDKYFLIDYKTYAVIDKNKLQRIKLQLTAYYWLLIKNGFQKLSNITYVYLTNKKEQKEIEITIQDLHEWNMALLSYKEWKETEK